MIRFPWLGLALVVAAADAPPASAQSRLPQIDPIPIVKQLKPRADRQEGDDVPVAYRPPPGMCRVWLKNVPAGQQPAVTDCASAVRNRPANGRVVFGDDYVDTKGDRRGGTPRDRRPRPTGPDSGRADARYTVVPGVGVSEGVAIMLTPLVMVERPIADGEHVTAAMQPPRDERTRDRVLRERQRERERRRIVAEGRAGRRVDRDRDYGDRSQRSGRAQDDDGRQLRGGTRGGTDRVIVVPPGGDPRYYDDRYAPPGRANGTCLDRDRDGWCDDPRYGAPVCLDRDDDGRCDDYSALAAAPFSSSLPLMRAGADVRGGRGSNDALQWLGTAEAIARTTDLNRDGVPERIQWLDANSGQLLQVWSDRNRDGVADRVEVYRNGRRVKLFGR